MTHHVIIFNTCFPGQRGVVLRMGFPVPVGCYARTPRDCKRLRSHMCMYIYICRQYIHTTHESIWINITWLWTNIYRYNFQWHKHHVTSINKKNPIFFDDGNSMGCDEDSMVFCIDQDRVFGIRASPCTNFSQYICHSFIDKL